MQWISENVQHGSKLIVSICYIKSVIDYILNYAQPEECATFYLNVARDKWHNTKWNLDDFWYWLDQYFREIQYKVVRIIKTEESRVGECQMIFSKKVY